MEHHNQTLVTYFIIKGISDLPNLQAPIFLLVLLIFIISIFGNLTIVLLVCLDHQLQTPMYFFLSNLSIMDLCSTIVTLHNVLDDFISGNNIISFHSCMTEMFLFIMLTCAELALLAVMSYDRYVAICNPLRYPMVMNWRVCNVLASVSWLLGFLDNIPNLYQVSSFTCYISNKINHFFCDIAIIMKLSCSDTSVLQLYMFIGSLFHIGLIPSLLTFISYIFIISTILKIRTSSGRRKAFYTCSSHLTVVILLYTTLFIQYLRPYSIDNLNSKKLLSLLNTAAVPVLNPLIYSLKNKDVKSAFKRITRVSKSFM
ncbi:olfactory receptor 8A1-like [Discoglossus pictus]